MSEPLVWCSLSTLLHFVLTSSYTLDDKYGSVIRSKNQ